MANPTAIVQSTQQFYDDVKGKWPAKATAGTYYPGCALGIRVLDGYAAIFDDSISMIFLGLLDGKEVTIDSGAADGDVVFDYVRPYRFNYPYQTSTLSRATDIGKLAFASAGAAGTVTISQAGLTFANCLGTIVDILPTTTPAGLTGAVVVIEPLRLSSTVTVAWRYNAPVDEATWIADKPYLVRSIKVRPRVVGSDGGAVTMQVRKAASTVAPSGGTVLHTGSADMKGAVDTDQSLTLSATLTDITMARGDALAMDVTGVTTAAVGMVTVELMPLG